MKVAGNSGCTSTRRSAPPSQARVNSSPSARPAADRPRRQGQQRAKLPSIHVGYSPLRRHGSHHWLFKLGAAFDRVIVPIPPCRYKGRACGEGSDVMGVNAVVPENYKPSDAEPFMNDRQKDYFRRKLSAWRNSIIAESKETLTALQNESENHPDIADRASSESDRAIELQGARPATQAHLQNRRRARRKSRTAATAIASTPASRSRCAASSASDRDAFYRGARASRAARAGLSRGLRRGAVLKGRFSAKGRVRAAEPFPPPAIPDRRTSLLSSAAARPCPSAARRRRRRHDNFFRRLRRRDLRHVLAAQPAAAVARARGADAAA